MAALAAQRIDAIVTTVHGEIGQWQTSLRTIANHHEDLEHRVSTAIAVDVMTEHSPGD